MDYAGRFEVVKEKDEIHLSNFDSSSEIKNQEVLYLMASCHSLTVKSQTTSKYTIDKSMFQVTGWHMTENAKNELIVSNEMSGAFKENKLILSQRFPFHSDKQTQSVVVYIDHEQRYAYYIKGMPKRIIEYCSPESVPSLTKERIEYYTKQGFKTIAMAHKNLRHPDGMSDELKKDLIFLGIIVFEDALAEGSKETIESLNVMKYDTLMCTGDNIDTAISVARKIGILPQESGTTIKDQVVHIKAVRDGLLSFKVSAYYYDDKSPYDLPSAWGGIWDSPQYVIDGESFEILDNVGGTELDRVLKSGKVFAEMKSKQKKDLVQLHIKKGHQTCMVGDGSNDNEALYAADVGISLNSFESGLTAPYYSTTNDIRSVPVLLNEGITINTQIMTIFMFTTCTSVLGMVSELMMYSMFYELSEAQWIYIDLFLACSIDLLLGYIESKETLKMSRQSKPFFNLTRILSMFCFITICASFQIGLLFYTKSQSWYTQAATNLDKLTEGSYESTYIFIILIFQLTFPAIVYTMENEPIYKNRVVFALMALLYCCDTVLDLFPGKFISETFELLSSPSVWFQIQIILMAVVNLALNIITELGFIFFNDEQI